MKDFVLSEPGGRAQAALKIDYQKELNEEQYQVVTAPDGPALVLAGAGSGKTRVITYRVAWLLEHGVSPQNILLLTFTNKAASEMVRRVELLLGAYPTGLWAGTFHAIGNRLLRRYATRLGYGENFSILDEEDARELVTLCIKECKIDTKGQKFPSANVLHSLLSYQSNTSQSLHDVLERKYLSFLKFEEDIARIAQMYKTQKLAQNAMDFDDLLLNLRALLREHTDVAEHLATQFQYVLVDEFQDTNVIQSEIVSRLTSVHHNVLAVGDDAQSIYSFRAAEIRNMLDFSQSYSGAQMYRLTTNYRSTPQILAVANAVIAHNQEQFSKELSAAVPSGDLPLLAAAASTSQEAQYIADQIAQLQEVGTALKEIAVLFRSSFHSQSLEFELMRRNVPYEYRGGMKFFERAHIKDAIAHIRILSNVKDGMAWIRALKIHPGVGLVTAGKIAAACAEKETVAEAIAISPVGGKAQSGWEGCARVLRGMASAKYPGDAVRAFLKSSEYTSYLEAEYPDAQDRVEDLEQFAIFAESYQSFPDFLEAVSLTDAYGVRREEGTEEEEKDRLILTTIHQAKGLEWNYVFVMHLAEGSFPSQRSMAETRAMEEERRLFYVAATRARRGLFLTYPATAGFDTIEVKQPSLFLSEIPEGHFERVRLRPPGWSSGYSRPVRTFSFGRAAEEGSDEPTIVLDDLGERVKKVPPSSYLGNY